MTKQEFIARKGCGHGTANLRQERGVVMFVVLVLLVVMLMGGLAFARMVDVGVLSSGNAMYRDSAVQASEIGINAAFQRLRQDVSEENYAYENYYNPSMKTTNAAGIPDVNFDEVPVITSGAYTINYYIERMCDMDAPPDSSLHCLLKQRAVPQSANAAVDQLDTPSSRQFRITVRVLGPKGTQAWFQSLVTKGPNGAPVPS